MLRTAMQRLIDAGPDSRVPAPELLDSVLPDIGNRSEKATAFWALLACSSVVAAVGVLMDSTATVIGAMVIAPLGTPIYGISAALVSGARAWPAVQRLLLGTLLAVAIGMVVDMTIYDTYPLTENPQVLARTSPSLPDLVVALATGIAGALALVRRDISPALPGVAIAISLVPPLSVVGIALSNAAWSDAFGAFVLFATNVLAIIFASLLVFGGARLSLPESERLRRPRRAAIVLAAASVVVFGALVAGTVEALRRFQDQHEVQQSAQEWDATHADWALRSVARQGDTIVVTFVGSGTAPTKLDGSRAALAKQLAKHGLKVDVQFLAGSLTSVS